jgi:molybdenum cofactor synthesis domain-containing protein
VGSIVTRHAIVVVVSTRAAAGVYADETGPVIVDWLSALGWNVDAPRVVPDGDQLLAQLQAAIAERPSLIVTTGGTGVAPTDRTPEATRALLEVELTGFGEELRRRGSHTTPLAILSRGTAGVVGATFIVNLPGSRGGVSDGLDVLGGILDHVVDQLDGGDHG